MKYERLIFLGWMFCVGCGSSGETKTKTDEAAPATSATSSRIRTTTKESTRQEQPLLAEGQVRVPLFVVPGDASVEVDNVVVRRRNGVVELVGKVGDSRRVRVFSGTTQLHETNVKIEANGAVPASIDARMGSATR